MLTWEPPPATGLGDRMGAWMVLLALGRLRNETVWLNWAPGWFRLPARIAADSQAALGCISFPSFARLQPEGGAAVRSIPLMWHKRQGGFAARPKPGVSVTARVRGGFNSVPHLMFGVWNRTDLLPPRSTAFTWRDYLHAYHEMAQLVRVRPACAPPIAQQQPAEPEEAAVEAAGTRLRMYVHLRRTDRGGEDDVRLGGAKGRGTRSRFEVQTHDAIRSLLEELTRQASTRLRALPSPCPYLALTLPSPSFSPSSHLRPTLPSAELPSSLEPQPCTPTRTPTRTPTCTPIRTLTLARTLLGSLRLTVRARWWATPRQAAAWRRLSSARPLALPAHPPSSAAHTPHTRRIHTAHSSTAPPRTAGGWCYRTTWHTRTPRCSSSPTPRCRRARAHAASRTAPTLRPPTTRRGTSSRSAARAASSSRASATDGRPTATSKSAVLGVAIPRT